MTTDSTPLKVEKNIVVSSFNTIDYYNLHKDFYQIPDSHPYWELVYVDSGAIISNYDGIGHTLSEGEVIFHPPGSSHSHISNRVVSNSILVVSFSSESEMLSTLKKKTFILSDKSKRILELFMEEARESLGNIENTSGGIPKPLKVITNIIGTTQMLECYFIEFLYSLVRDSSYNVLKKSRASHILASNSFVELVKNYLNDNIYKSLTLEDLCLKFHVSKSNLCKKWKEYSDIGIIDYFISLKIEKAKKLLEQNEYNITQIADMLNYTTIHHFSHSFKKNTGMSPREYKNSIC